MGLFDFERQLTFYGSYHSNKVNILCHIICVPLIIWTALVLASASGPIIDVGILSQLGIIPNAAFFIILVYISYYLALEPIAGLLYSPLLLMMAKTATSFYFTNSHAVSYAIALHVFGWACQIFTHKFFEGRSPALLDNFSQALLTAPLFVFLEVLFILGYRPSLNKRVQNRVGVAITKYRRQVAAEKRSKEQKQ